MNFKDAVAWGAVAGTLFFTVLGQLLIKWQMGRLGDSSAIVGASIAKKVVFYTHVLLNPWIVVAYVSAFLASLFWLVAMRRLPISTAYPFMAIGFVLVVAAGVWLFNESLQPMQVIGISLVVLGVALVGAGA